jgi:hypothetical protein
MERDNSDQIGAWKDSAVANLPVDELSQSLVKPTARRTQRNCLCQIDRCWMRQKECVRVELPRRVLAQQVQGLGHPVLLRKRRRIHNLCLGSCFASALIGCGCLARVVVVNIQIFDLYMNRFTPTLATTGELAVRCFLVCRAVV